MSLISLDAVRQALFAQVKATLATYDSTLLVEYENLEIKDKNDTKAYVYCALHFSTGQQASMESNPRTRYHGELQLLVMIKAGTGTKVALDIADALTKGLKYKNLGGTQIQAPRLMGGKKQGDWYGMPVMFTFYTDID